MTGFKTFTAAPLTVSDVNEFLMKQARVICTTGTRPSAPFQGQFIYETDSRRTLEYDGAVWVQPGGGAWLSFSSGLQQGVTPPASTADARYTQTGKMVQGQVFQLFTGSGTPGSAIVCSMPVTPLRNSNVAVIGQWTFAEVSTGTYYVGSLQFMDSANSARFAVSGQTDTFGTLPAVTIANGDIMSYSFAYEAL